MEYQNLRMEPALGGAALDAPSCEEAQGPHAHPWTPHTWKTHRALQQPLYPDTHALTQALMHLEGSAPIVQSGDIARLRRQLFLAQMGQAFVLQAGDCAETFADCNDDAIAARVEFLRRMSLEVENRLDLPAVTLGRMGGQYAKPRSQSLEETPKGPLPVFRGEIINGMEATLEARQADPQRLLEAHRRARITSLRSKELSGSLDLWLSHESLLLPWEAAMTRRTELGWTNLSTHFLWLGERTRFLGSAHVEYLRGVANPMGVKVSAQTAPHELIPLLKTLNPNREAGKLAVIFRLGSAQTAKSLPALARALRQLDFPVLLMCDPMHGNTRTVDVGGRPYKTRHMEDILQEVQLTAGILQAEGLFLGGLHLEATPEAVTECVGSGILLGDLPQCWRSACDPRLNPKQTLDAISAVADASVRVG